MPTYTTVTAANCHAGTWRQQWNCGWNDHSSAAYQAGYSFGHNILPILAVLFVLVLLVRAVKKRGKSRSSAPAGARR
jgi:disulfide bond formation protein DsbB